MLAPVLAIFVTFLVLVLVLVLVFFLVLLVIVIMLEAGIVIGPNLFHTGENAGKHWLVLPWCGGGIKSVFYNVTGIFRDIQLTFGIHRNPFLVFSGEFVACARVAVSA